MYILDVMGLSDTEGDVVHCFSMVRKDFMSCYHPLVGFPSGKITENGKEQLVIKKDYLKTHSLDEVNRFNGVLLPCGHCIGCRLDYSRRWADRMMLELETSKSAIFVTLTYDNDHIHWSQFDDNNCPIFGTLDKRDCQLFMKRLRKEFEDVKIRFYLAGEYGEHTLRPHYHAIIYGIGLSDIGDCIPFGRNDNGQAYYISKRFQEIWSLGNVLLADVSWQTCAYVARYVTKKLNGEKSVSYAQRNVIPEFSLMSRKPGIGREYLDLHPDCLDAVNINLSTPEGGLKISIPKYYLKQLELSDSDKYVKIMEQRKRFASDSLLLKLSNTDNEIVDYLSVCEGNKLAKLKALKRKV